MVHAAHLVCYGRSLDGLGPGSCSSLRSAGAPAGIARWEGYKKAGPLLISTDHHGTADGKPFRLFLSDISVKVTGSDSWINAE